MNRSGRGGLAPSFRSIVGLGVLVLLLLLTMGGLRGFRELHAARQREAELEARLATARAGIAGLEERIERLRHDPALLERLARDQLMMIRPGEAVILFGRDSEPPPATPSPAPPPPSEP